MICCVQNRTDGARGDDMIEMRRTQLGFDDGLITEEVSDLREEWMRHADQVLADEQIVAAVHEALAEAASEEPQPRAAGHSSGSGVSPCGPRRSTVGTPVPVDRRA